MRHFKLTLTLLAAATLVACGGGAGTDTTTDAQASAGVTMDEVQAYADGTMPSRATAAGGVGYFRGVTSQVVFGDSLSDLGTYGVGTVAALGGGKYTINNVVNGKNQSLNWTEWMALAFGLPAPCAAQTGLNGLASQGFSVPVVNHAGCTSYAQGGARVTNPVGPGNALLGGSNAILGQLTVPVVTQVAKHLSLNGGKFNGKEMVYVLAGANDAFMQLAGLSAGATAAATAAVTAAVPAQIGADIAAGICLPANASTTCVSAAVAKLSPTVGAAAAGAYFQTNAPAAVGAMGVAGAELANQVNSQMLAKGAKRVTVINVPDISKTPFAATQSPEVQGLVNTMVTTFNAQLKANLSTSASVLLVDAYTISRDQVANPAKYFLANVTTPACDLTPAKNPLGSSLTCTTKNLIPGVVSRFQFADGVHPTPYAQGLLAVAVSAAVLQKGWFK
jgi:outer membrane lipase/esterase